VNRGRDRHGYRRRSHATSGRVFVSPDTDPRPLNLGAPKAALFSYHRSGIAKVFASINTSSCSSHVRGMKIFFLARHNFTMRCISEM
jgi:hypothetical protein